MTTDIVLACTAIALGTFALRYSGVLLGRHLQDHPLSEVTMLLVIGMLSALVVVQTVSTNAGPQMDARFVGVATAGVIAILTRSLAGAFIAGIAATALVRAIT